MRRKLRLQCSRPVLFFGLLALMLMGGIQQETKAPRDLGLALHLLDDVLWPPPPPPPVPPTP